MTNTVEQTEDLPVISRGAFFERLDAMKLVNGALRIESAGDAYRMARLVMGSQLANPKWTEKEIFLILLNGQEIGLSVNQALANSYIVNNKVSIYGSAPKALVEASGLMEDFKQSYEGVYPEDTFKAVITSKRRGRDPITTEYSIGDAKEAGLWEKSAIDRDGIERAPWQTSRKRMLHWRALQANLTDNFSDVLKGTLHFEAPPDEPGFERARPAVGRVVEPNFDGAREAFVAGVKAEIETRAAEPAAASTPAPAVAPMPEPAKRRGRPPGSRNQRSLFPEPAPAAVPSGSETTQTPSTFTTASMNKLTGPAAEPAQKISEATAKAEERPKESATDAKVADSMGPQPAPPPAEPAGVKLGTNRLGDEYEPPAEPAKETPPPAEPAKESEPLRQVKEWLASAGITPAELVALLVENEYASAGQELHELDEALLRQVLAIKEKVKNLVEKNRVP